MLRTGYAISLLPPLADVVYGPFNAAEAPFMPGAVNRSQLAPGRRWAVRLLDHIEFRSPERDSLNVSSPRHADNVLSKKI